MKVYRHATSDPFSFMYINNKFKKGERIYKNFTHQLQVSDRISKGKNDAADGDDTDGRHQEKNEKTTIDVAVEK